MYHYTECGLNNVWLANGYDEHETPYGAAVSIADVDGLHRAIALHLIKYKPRLSGGEFRFLRKELDLSQAALARVLGNDAQSVARWEKNGRPPKMAERFLRALYREHAEGNARIQDIVQRLNETDRKAYQQKVIYEKAADEWRELAA